MNSYIKPVKKACQNIAKAPFCLANSNHILHKFTRLFIKSVVGTKLGHLYYFPFWKNNLFGFQTHSAFKE